MNLSDIKAPQILYFINDTAPTDEEYADALQYPGVKFRNANYVGEGEKPEVCDGVASLDGEIPASYRNIPSAKTAFGTFNKQLAALQKATGDAKAPVLKSQTAIGGEINGADAVNTEKKLKRVAYAAELGINATMTWDIKDIEKAIEDAEAEIKRKEQVEADKEKETQLANGEAAATTEKNKNDVQAPAGDKPAPASWSSETGTKAE